MGKKNVKFMKLLEGLCDFETAGQRRDRPTKDTPEGMHGWKAQTISQYYPPNFSILKVVKKYINNHTSIIKKPPNINSTLSLFFLKLCAGFKELLVSYI